MKIKSNSWTELGQTVFSEMSQLANLHQAVNLAQGFPEFDGPSEIKDAAIRAMKAGANQYAPSAGLIELREKIATRRANQTGVQYCADSEVTIFSGATEALFVSFTTLLNSGDEVLSLAPVFDSYQPVIESRGATLLVSPLLPPSYEIDVDHLKSLVSTKTKMLILNTPHNPTGRVFNKEEIEAVCELAIANDLIVVTDEVYEELVFDENTHVSPSQIEGMRERSVVISSTSKTYSMTGWKIGYALAPPHITKVLRNAHQYVVFCSATPLQHGMLAALDFADQYYDSLRRDYDERRHLMVDGLRAAGLSCELPEGSYFAVASYEKFSKLPSYEFARKLTIEGGVASIPIGSFAAGDKNVAALRVLRFGFCKSSQSIKDGCERLRTYLNSDNLMT